MKVRWSPEAFQDRADIWAYLTERNPVAAVRMDVLFSKAADRLSSHPAPGGYRSAAGCFASCPSRSTGTGNTRVELLSPATWVSVWR
ncbi:type II toxin-antitoxin system RelE/ParE family toxin [Thauera aromatica]|uniref:type II toxin-antitoxin system RelE/ParE family toxin n=1 Tax=Thauera aromatica TaxID=59405 RepID=UPI000D16B186|nr:type II toxin-antitoxin system RelE/ParE family toxin [Thauera aromatica]